MKYILLVCSFLVFIGKPAKALDLSRFVDEAALATLGDEAKEDQNIEESPVPEADEGPQVVDFEVDNQADIIFGAENETKEAKVNPKATLTENFSENNEKPVISKKKSSKGQASEQTSAKEAGSWVGKLLSEDVTPGKKNKSALDDLMSETKASNFNTRSNAAVFDISGVMLRMNLAQADDALKRRGYKRISQKLEIPNFIKWRNEEVCRGSGVVGYERLAACVSQKAKKDNYEYVETAKYAKFDTKESMEIHLTSTFTNNKIYKIIYRSEAALIRGSSQKAAYLRNLKIFDFWRRINQKYGAPDNRDDAIWGMGGNRPYMQAQTGLLVLEDPVFRELDYTRMSREDMRIMSTDMFTF